MGVAEQFTTFNKNLWIDKDTISDISRRYKAITKRLTLDFWALDNETYFSRYVGSYGRDTAICGFSDLDMIFKLPGTLFSRYDQYQGNGQSALLQAVRQSIMKTYPNTYIKGDGQVVKIDFTDDISFEIVPAFENTDGSYKFPDSNEGGTWRKTDPMPEIKAIAEANNLYNKNLKRLCRMIRSWKRKWNVPMGGLLIDTLAYNFMVSWAHNDKSFLYYDYMSRDFFKFLANQRTTQTLWFAVGSGQHVYRKGPFENKAKQCYELSLEAINNQEKGYEYSAKKNWREIYGTQFPE